MVTIPFGCWCCSGTVCWYLHYRLSLTIGVLTGIISSCGAIERLSLDHVLPTLFRRRLKFSNAPYVSIIVFTGIGLAMFGVVDANLSIIADQFTVSFLIILSLFALSNLFLKFNRDRLVRGKQVSLPFVLFALAVVIAALVGNIILAPVIVGYFAIFFVITLAAMSYTSVRGQVATVIYWLYNRNRWLHSLRCTESWAVKLRENIRRSKKQPVIFFAKTDEVPFLMTRLI